MCFSASASFITATGLSIISLLSFKKVSAKSYLIPLALSPFFFALQQAGEGIVWLTMNKGDSISLLHKIGVYGFLFFAACWWPIWIPWIFLRIEKNNKRKKLLSVVLCIGIISAIFLFLSWIMQTSGAHIINHHLDYPVTNYPFDITPFFISTIPYTWILGSVISIGLIISYIFYYMAFPSVWCFFAALSSAILYIIL
jgi:hypothetical protein